MCHGMFDHRYEAICQKVGKWLFAERKPAQLGIGV
jgi:hypothetical protein